MTTVTKMATVETQTHSGVTEAMPAISIRLDDEQSAWLESQTTRYRKKVDVIRDLIDSARLGVDRPTTLGVASGSEQLPSSSSKAVIEEEIKTNKTKTRARGKSSDPFSVKQLPDDAIPKDLVECGELLREFWAVKKGTRSEGVYKRVCGKLRAWTPEDRRKALEAAISGGWGDVFEPRPNPQNKWNPEPVAKHPASRVFTAADFDVPNPDNPLKNLF